MKILLVAGARPNFMKIAPLVHELNARSKEPRWRKKLKAQNQELNWKIVHTGQHYDYEMSKVFFDELSISEPDYFLGAGSGTHAEQTAKIMQEAADKGIKQVWIQQRSEDDESVRLAGENNINLIHKKCMFMFADPVTGPHAFHRFLSKLFGSFPK